MGWLLSMYATEAKTDCLIYFTSVWTVIVQRRIQFMNFSGVIGTAAPVSRFLTSSPQMETPYQLDKDRQWHDWSK